MTRYDIDPVGVQGVLSKVEVHLRDLDATAGKLATALSDAAQASGSGKVAGALSDWSNVRATDLSVANTTGWDAVQGTGIAVVAYLQGDLAMVRSAQSCAAMGVPYTPPGKGSAPVHGPDPRLHGAR